MSKKSFEEIAPQWSKKIRSGKMVQNYYLKKLQGGDFAKCIVGEAWKFTDTYASGFSHTPVQYEGKGCKECFDLGNQFYFFPEKFEKTKKAFVDHFNAVHLKDFSELRSGAIDQDHPEQALPSFKGDKIS